MDQDAISQYIVDTLDGVDVVVADGNSFFFYDPGGELPVDHRFPFATLVTNDLYDQASNLDRPSVYGLNVGVSRATFTSLFGTHASPSGAGGDDDSGYDFTALDRLMPHPVYGQMFWVCVLNPSAETFESVKPLLAEAHSLAAGRHARRGWRRPRS
jgi:Family of unknown function (DUF6194)